MRNPFDTVARYYHPHAEVQHEACRVLYDMLFKHLRDQPIRRWVDLGCGPGVHTRALYHALCRHDMQVIESHQVYTSDLNVECHQAVQREALPIHILGIDRASEMIAEARRRQDTIHEPGLVFLEGDFDAFDRLSGMTSGQSAFFEPEGLVSNFALHWSADVKKLLTRLPRARMMVFSVPVRGTFRELRNPPMLCAFEEIDEVCSTLGYNTFVCERKTWRCGFNSPMEAVRSLKQTGVMHFPRVRSAPVGLMTQDRLKQCFHEPEEISLTY